ncbi:MAG: hypothetical protein E7227_06535 [Clostridiales bacterium]|nr:hypothetical protein [Clostridiales bacterium]
MSRKWIVAILVYIGLIALCCIVVYAVPSVRGMLEKTYIAQNGTIDVKDEVSGFIVRDETVYAAAEKSKINRLAETDKLVKADTRVVELTPTEEEPEEAKSEETKDSKSEDNKEAKSEDTKTKDKKDAKSAESEEETADNTGRYRSIMEELGDSVKVTEKGATKDPGYVSYYVDGAENKLNTDNLDGLTEKDLKDLTGRKAVKVPEKHCGKGYPVFKIVRNSKWYLVFFEDNESAARYVPGETVTIDINGEPVTVTVSRVDSGTKTSKIALSCKSFFDGFFEMRELDTTVTFVSAEGLVLEDSSIVEAPDGRRGVFVKNKLGEHVFKPIRAKADDGTKCVVFADIYVDAEGNFVETIKTYDEIIAEPTEDDLASLKKKVKKEKEPQAKETPAESKDGN